LCIARVFHAIQPILQVSRLRCMCCMLQVEFADILLLVVRSYGREMLGMSFPSLPKHRLPVQTDSLAVQFARKATQGETHPHNVRCTCEGGHYPTAMHCFAPIIT
jgi:hypothetical protein